jgi:cellulose synthase/poly-beta-1,6-N-acetylglucosamine synthase-like glycosyltransferase
LISTDSRITKVSNPSGRTANALNLAINAAKYEYIVRIDGHSEIDSDYISRAISILQSKERANVVNVGGIMAAEGITLFQKAVARAMRSSMGVGSSRFHTGGEAGETDTVYLGVFKKSALVAIGGFDERFTRAQDWELNYRLRTNGGTIWFDPDLKVTYRPRRTLLALAKQYFEYGRWRRAVSRRHLGTVNFRYLAPPIAVSINALSIILALTSANIFITPVLIYLLSMILGGIVIGKSWGERLLLPLVMTTMHHSWGLGFLTSPKRLIS